ncbi:dUTPase [Burkholderia ambifaria]|uniref:dUTPase n=1 Tax=Burkholderia ambifaria TaxID=152480 RepID=UPI0015912C79|nr:dUTPase [Burkholderia ambifaria]
MRRPSIRQIGTILRIQGRLNHRIDANWLANEYPFMRAVVVEVAEALDHYGWKWWSTQQRRLDQMTIELIDILGLLVSDVMQRCDGDIAAAAAHILQHCLTDNNICELDGVRHDLDGCGVPDLLDLLAALAVCHRDPFFVIARLFERLGLTWEDVTMKFVAKTVLSVFRQDHGYKLGTYRKIWSGVEDNEHLSCVLTRLDASAASDDSFFDRVYDELARRYRVHAVELDGT